MRQFIIVSIIVGFFIGVIFILWIVMNSVLYADDGLVSELDDMAQEDMDGEFLNNWNDHVANDDDSFGFIGALLIAALFGSIMAYAFRRRRQHES